MSKTYGPYTTKEVRVDNVEEIASSINGAEKLDSYMQKKKTGPFSCTKHKNKLKMSQDLNLRAETIKCLKENISSDFFDISHYNTLLEMSLRARETK